ncbi:MAG: P-loop containing nucleoside triphosphate hydrolase protein [Monoraphidium minutum]|nr:MAG: P-loop containing nucleoside triphosphate hydrolase protein [Monoraphidium minutum]
MARAGQEDAVAAKLRQFCAEQQLKEPDAVGISLGCALFAAGPLLTARTSAALKLFVRDQRPLEFAIVNVKKPGTAKKYPRVVCLKLPPPGAGTGAGGGAFACRLCNVTCNGPTDLQNHFAGKGHQARAAAQGGDLWCDLCSHRSSNEDAHAQHVRSGRHKALLMQRQYAQSGGRCAARNGVTAELVPRELSGLVPDREGRAKLRVTNSGAVALRVVAVSQMRAVAGVEVAGGAEGSLLPPNTYREIDIFVVPPGLGLIQSLLVVDLGAFCVSALLSAACDGGADDPLALALAPTAPYAPKPRPARQERVEIVRGEKPYRLKGMWKSPPGQHDVPGWLRAEHESDRLARARRELELEATTAAQHIGRLALMVWLEELQQERDVRQYDINKAELAAAAGGRLLVLQVPGLAEARPSVMLGDRLYVKRDAERREWEGYVHAVERDQVLLRFSPQFHREHVGGARYRVRFSIKRSTFVFMHEALALARDGQLAPQLLLPSGVACGGAAPAKKSLPEPSWLNPNLNEEQRAAVRAVLRGAHAPAPYLVFGPPGTGKTSTLVEMAAQVLRTDPSVRVLLLAPSNTAADQLVQRLMGPGAGRPKSEVLRVNAYQRPRVDMTREVLDVSTWSDAGGRDSGCFELPSAEAVMAKRAVAATAIMGAKLHARGVKQGFFTHIFMDEAGHAEEPLALAGVAGLAGPSTRVVLVGDPRQLGPVVHSRLALDKGLALSWMERLIGRHPYVPSARGDYDASYITQLVRNYRSHPDLLALPSRLFYGGRLRACANPILTHSVLQSGFELPNQSFPMLFHGIVGRDEREANSPSWFNPMEAQQVVKYVEALMAVRRNRIAANEIGVITPYNKQVQKLRTVLNNKFGANNIQVGSVEQFQGQERKVIIISTVRSGSEYVEIDLRHRLGFVRNEKRFNVAVTRAKALLIVVGNPVVLAKDPCWAALLRLAADKGAYTGTAPLPVELLGGGGGGDGGGGGGGGVEEEMAELCRRLERVVVSGSGRWEPEDDGGLGADEAGGARVEGLPMRRVE